MSADYFISYTGADAKWAEWIAWVLEEKQNCTTILQAWDFVPGSNFVLEMHKAAASASRTIAVLSPDYLRSTFAKPEWAAAVAQDPEGLQRKLVPVMVRDCTPDGLLIPIVHIKLMNLSQEAAEDVLVKGLLGGRQKPAQAPAFPGRQSPDEKAPKPFPGKAGETESRPLGRPSMPRLKGMITDLDRTRFIKQSFTIIRQYFRDGVDELGKHPAVDAEFTEISATAFTAEAFINGKKAGRCKIWFGEMFAANKICYYEGDDNFGNAFNEALSVAHDDYELYLSALMKTGFGRAESVKKMDLSKLSPEEAAEYLWQRFISKSS
jgi:hypothetical protein